MIIGICQATVRQMTCLRKGLWGNGLLLFIRPSFKAGSSKTLETRLFAWSQAV